MTQQPKNFETSTPEAKSSPMYSPALVGSKGETKDKTPQEIVMGSSDIFGKIIGFNNLSGTLNVKGTSKKLREVLKVSLEETGENAKELLNSWAISGTLVTNCCLNSKLAQFALLNHRFYALSKEDCLKIALSNQLLTAGMMRDFANTKISLEAFRELFFLKNQAGRREYFWQHYEFALDGVNFLKDGFKNALANRQLTFETAKIYFNSIKITGEEFLQLLYLRREEENRLIYFLEYLSFVQPSSTFISSFSAYCSSWRGGDFSIIEKITNFNNLPPWAVVELSLRSPSELTAAMGMPGLKAILGKFFAGKEQADAKTSSLTKFVDTWGSVFSDKPPPTYPWFAYSETPGAWEAMEFILSQKFIDDRTKARWIIQNENIAAYYIKNYPKIFASEMGRNLVKHVVDNFPTLRPLVANTPGLAKLCSWNHIITTDPSMAYIAFQLAKSGTDSLGLDGLNRQELLHLEKMGFGEEIIKRAQLLKKLSPEDLISITESNRELAGQIKQKNVTPDTTPKASWSPHFLNSEFKAERPPQLPEAGPSPSETNDNDMDIKISAPRQNLYDFLQKLEDDPTIPLREKKYISGLKNELPKNSEIALLPWMAQVSTELDQKVKSKQLKENEAAHIKCFLDSLDPQNTIRSSNKENSRVFGSP